MVVFVSESSYGHGPSHRVYFGLSMWSWRGGLVRQGCKLCVVPPFGVVGLEAEGI